jgi:hypothetical protein
MQDENVQSEAMRRITTAVSKYMPFISLQTFTPIIDHFENKEVAKIGIVVGYIVPRLNADVRNIEVILYSAG